MSENNFMNTDTIELCRFYDDCAMSEFVRNSYKDGEESKLVESEKKDYQKHCIRGGHCEPLYGDFLKLEKGKPAKTNLNEMDLYQEIEVEEALFNRAAKFGDIN